MIIEIFLGVLLLILLIIIIYILMLWFVAWYSRKEMFDDKYNYYMSDEYNKNRKEKITKQEAKEKAEWHIK